MHRLKLALIIVAVQSLRDAVNKLRSDPESKGSNRVGVLFGNHQTAQTKTITHTLWTLFNILPAHSIQKPHRHTPTALDLCVSAPKEGKFVMMHVTQCYGTELTACQHPMLQVL